MNKQLNLAVTVTLTLALSAGDALAQRAGGRAGGARPGGGGRVGAAAGGGAGPSFNRTPAMTAPGPQARPQTPGGGARPNPGANQRPGNQPGTTPGNRPQVPNAGERPGMPQQRPGVNPPALGGNRPPAANRPNIGNNTGNVANRPNIGNNTGNVANRPNIGNNTGNVANRPNIGNNTGNVVNRPNIGNTVNVGINNRPGGSINSGNINVNKNINNINVFNNVNINNVNRPAWATGNPNWAYRPGWGNHQGWVNGYWHGQNNNWWGNGGAFMTGLAVGGIGAWGIGSSLYGWGYRPYVNPYVMAAPVVVTQPVVVQQPAQTTVVVQQPASAPAAAPVDYSQPLSNSALPPEPAVADPAIQTFDAGRAAFMAGNYQEALQKTDEALKTLPNDAAINEFRALCLFALKQYDPAAGTLYAVLSAGPGWDWTTLSGLYPSVGVYTAQVRALEDYRTQHPQDPASRFVLAYHYLTQGHTDAAAEDLRAVVQLHPSDQLSAQLLTQLTGEKAQKTPGAVAESATPATPTPAPAAGAQPAVAPGNLLGSWKGSPAAGTTIELTLGADGKFVWNVVTQGKSQPIQGKFALDKDVLTLSQSEANQMVGKVAWQDEGHFHFQAMGGGPGDPGLLFSK